MAFLPSLYAYGTAPLGGCNGWSHDDWVGDVHVLHFAIAKILNNNGFSASPSLNACQRTRTTPALDDRDSSCSQESWIVESGDWVSKLNNANAEIVRLEMERDEIGSQYLITRVSSKVYSAPSKKDCRPWLRICDVCLFSKWLARDSHNA